MRHLLFILIVGFIVVEGCKTDDAPVVTFNSDSVIVAWLDSFDISATRDDAGFYFYAEQENPAGNFLSSGAEVGAIFYTLFDLDSNVLASYQRNDGDSLLLKIGSGAIYPVILDACLRILRTGETYSFLLPGELAYQEVTGISTADETGVVRLNLSLVAALNEQDVFAAEAVAIEDYIQTNSINDTISIDIERIDTTFLGMTIVSIDTTFSFDIDSAVYFPTGVRYKEQSGGGGPQPIIGEDVTVNYTASFLNGGVFQNRQGFQFEFGGNVPNVLFPGFTQAIEEMSVGEQGLLITPSSQAYRESAFILPFSLAGELVDLDIVPEYAALVPPYSTLLFTISRTN